MAAQQICWGTCEGIAFFAKCVSHMIRATKPTCMQTHAFLFALHDSIAISCLVAVSTCQAL